MNTHKHISELHSELKEWLGEVRFAHDEIGTFKNRLGEVISQNTAKDMLAQAEHFQNMWVRQDEVTDELIHDLKHQENVLTELVKSNPVASDRRLKEDHTELRDKMESYRKIYAESKHDFQRFIASWL